MKTANGPTAVIVMGVTGSGKTTIGKALAARLGCAFFDGDDYHPLRNVNKMRRGEPLDDADRAPWLDRLRELITEEMAKGEDMVLACSALRECYRERLRPAGHVIMVYLQITAEVARQRVLSRPGHFMPAGLVDSQFDALEEPEDAVCVDASRPPEEVVQKILRRLG